MISKVENLKKKFNSGWQVPDFEIVFLKKKTSKIALIIPVINEGENLISLIKRINKLLIYNHVDILIIDGGSKDDSLEINNLKDNNINALIEKKGNGKLCSQLRIGYALSIVLGYDSIITIDGNNKDDPKYILDFMVELEKGYDMIQATRFSKGGSHKNTPLSRYLAIRIFHAPILSFASGFNWSDTTQGFRGYSKRLLVSNEIGVFRELFDNYQLLPYLSYIAPKKQYKCKEIGTRRIYPKGKTPTKIKKIRGKLIILYDLIAVCLGLYNVK